MISQKSKDIEVNNSRLNEVRKMKVGDTRFQFEDGKTFTVKGCTVVKREDGSEIEVLITTIGFINIESRERSRYFLPDGTRYVPDGELDKIIQKARQNDDTLLGDAHDQIEKECKGKTFVCKYKRLQTEEGKHNILHLCLFSEALATRKRATK